MKYRAIFDDLKFCDRIIFNFFAKRLIRSIVLEHYRKDGRKKCKSFLDDKKLYSDWRNAIYTAVDREVQKTYDPMRIEKHK